MPEGLASNGEEALRHLAAGTPFDGEALAGALTHLAGGEEPMAMDSSVIDSRKNSLARR